jgi:hypothetical protein
MKNQILSLSLCGLSILLLSNVSGASDQSKLIIENIIASEQTIFSLISTLPPVSEITDSQVTEFITNMQDALAKLKREVYLSFCEQIPYPRTETVNELLAENALLLEKLVDHHVELFGIEDDRNLEELHNIEIYAIAAFEKPYPNEKVFKKMRRFLAKIESARPQAETYGNIKHPTKQNHQRLKEILELNNHILEISNQPIPSITPSNKKEECLIS